MRVALLLLVAALPAFAGGDISIKDAIRKLEAKRQFLIDNHIANMQQRAAKDPEVARALATGELQARSRIFIGQMHDDVIARLRAQDKPGATVSSREVDGYVEAFRKELFALRDAMVAQTHEQQHGPAASKAVDWDKILAGSRDARQKIVEDYQSSPVDHPGPVRLSNIVIETLNPEKPGASAGTVPKAPGTGAAANPGNPIPTAPEPAGAGEAPPNPAGAAQTASRPEPAAGGSGVAPKSPEQSANDRLALGDVSGATSDLNAAANAGAAGPDAYALRGELAMNDGRFAAAVQDARQALQADPKNQNALAVLHNSEGRVDGAPPDQAGAAPGSAPAPEIVGGGASGSAYGGSAGSPAASGASGAGSPGGPASSSGLSHLSAGQARTQAALGMNDLGAARTYVERALAQEPGNPSLLNLRAQISARGGDYASARSDAMAGLALAPNDPALRRTLGYAQVRGRDYRGAMATANGLMERDPNDAYAYALRAHAYGSLGDRDAMLADLKRAEALDPRFRQAAAKMENQTQLPTDTDILFLFPGESPVSAAAAPPPAPPGPRRGLLFGACAAGGLLLALGLVHLLRRGSSPEPEAENEA